MELGSRRLISIGLGMAAILVAVFIVPKFVSSYYYEQGRKFYLKDSTSGKYFEEARANLNRSLLFSSKSPAPYVYLGRIALGRVDAEGDEYYPDADWTSALSLYQKAFELGIKNGDDFLYAHTLEHLGHAYLRAGQYEKAKEIYLLKIGSFPDSLFGDRFGRSTFWPRFSTAEMDFERFNKPQEAEELLLPVANFANADPRGLYRVHLLLARLYSYFENWEQAEKYANFALANIPASAEDVEAFQVAHSILAVVAGAKKDFVAAEREVRNARGFGAAASEDCVLVSAYFFGGAYRRALEVIDKIEKPESFLYRYRYSVCLAYGAEAAKALGNKAEARRRFEEYLRYTDTIDPKNIFVMRFRQKFADELERLN